MQGEMHVTLKETRAGMLHKETRDFKTWTKKHFKTEVDTLGL